MCMTTVLTLNESDHRQFNECTALEERCRARDFFDTTSRIAIIFVFSRYLSFYFFATFVEPYMSFLIEPLHGSYNHL